LTGPDANLLMAGCTEAVVKELDAAKAAAKAVNPRIV
jgi:hypothetical protein